MRHTRCFNDTIEAELLDAFRVRRTMGQRITVQTERLASVGND